MKIEIKSWRYNSKTHKTEEFTKTIELTEEELAAAIVADSIGYATPEHALMHVRDYLKGQRGAYCERAAAIFGCDLEALIKSAAYFWYRCTPKEREAHLKYFEAWKRLEEKDSIASWAVSSLYPTAGPL